MADETIILRPPRPAAAPEPEAETPPLRAPVLGGAFFGAPNAETAARLSAFARGGTAADAVRDWFGSAAAPRLLADREALRGALDRDIAAIDALISAQLDAILHHPRLLRLEGSWRGLAWLVEGIEPGRRIKVRVLPASWPEICRDLERAPEFDRSNLFRLIYEDEFGMPGGEPYGVIVVDHEMRHRPAPGAPTDDVSAVASLAAIGAAAFAPVVLGAHPALLEVDGWPELAMVQEVTQALSSPEHARWRGLANRADLRFIGVTLPRLLARPPWRDDPLRVDRFRYVERAPDWASRCWMSAAYAFAACACRAYALHGWPADVRGVETDRVGGGLVEHVAEEPFASGPREAWWRVPAEISLSDRQERQLVDAGLIPVCALPYTREMVFGAVRSLQAPARHMGQNAAAADASARLSAQVNALLCAARFAHYIKVMGRDMVGSIQTAGDIQRRLHGWLQTYVNANRNATGEQRARYPLAEGQISVEEKPGKPGVFGCTVHLRPHHQLDDVSATFILLTEISAPGRRGGQSAS
jgi:type VI secretion system protein ImpD/type VI secretion system protein ImpC